jgi:hypothetical protein
MCTVKGRRDSPWHKCEHDFISPMVVKGLGIASNACTFCNDVKNRNTVA